jgi:hypothetical protein
VGKSTIGSSSAGALLKELARYVRHYLIGGKKNALFRSVPFFFFFFFQQKGKKKKKKELDLHLLGFSNERVSTGNDCVHDPLN